MQIRNGCVLIDGTFQKTDLCFANGVITQIGAQEAAEDSFDAAGLFVIPGFVDTHIHGACGADFAVCGDRYDAARRWLAAQGVTAIAASVRALPVEETVAAEQWIRKENHPLAGGAKILGIHLEGPFVSHRQTGVMRPPDETCTVAAYRQMAEAGGGLLRIMTLAPERENAVEVIRAAAADGVAVSLGHTDATYAEAAAAIDAGAKRATHTFNAMRPFSHRETGILGAVLTDPRVMCEMIADLVHLDPATIRILIRQKGYDGINLISDTGPVAGMPDGTYMINGAPRTVANGVCRGANGRIAGSTTAMTTGAQNLVKMGYPLEAVSKMASENPARALGADGFYGQIRPGYTADVIVCDRDLQIKAVFSDGEKIRNEEYV